MKLFFAMAITTILMACTPPEILPYDDIDYGKGVVTQTPETPLSEPLRECGSVSSFQDCGDDVTYEEIEPEKPTKPQPEKPVECGCLAVEFKQEWFG